MLYIDINFITVASCFQQLRFALPSGTMKRIWASGSAASVGERTRGASVQVLCCPPTTACYNMLHQIFIKCVSNFIKIYLKLYQHILIYCRDVYTTHCFASSN